MGRTRKFCGKTTTLWRKCENCEKRESCMQVDKDFIAKESSLTAKDSIMYSKN